MKFRLICTLISAMILVFTACSDDETWEDRVSNFIENRYPGANVTDYIQRIDGTKVTIRHNNINKELWFNVYEEWEYTQWQIPSTDVPVVVINTLENSAYSNYLIEEIKAREQGEGMLYIFTLASSSQKEILTINEDGEILN